MQELEKIAEDLFEKIRSRFEGVSLGNDSAQATSAPDKARFFNFDYIAEDGENFGNVTVSIIDENSLKVYFSKNISQQLDDVQRKEWYEFLYDLRKFAKRHLMTFDTRDVSRSNLNIKDIKQVSKSDANYNTKDVAVTESRLYGTPKTSFENVGSARIRIVHTESVNPEVRGGRARHINAIYVENSQGERFRMPFSKLGGARAMARHISEGGAPYDDIGQAITGMVMEMNELGTFVRGMRRRTFEDAVSQNMLEAAVSYYNGMHRQLNHLKGNRAYQSFVENFEPSKEQLDEVDLNELKERFVKKIFDDRMTAALPHVYKAYQLQEQSRRQQAESVREIVRGQDNLQLATNESMDEYMKMLSFEDADSLVVSVLEDIAERAVSMPEVAEFASHWAKNWNSITENDDATIKENRSLAVQLATQYIKDLGRLKENTELRTTMESDLIDFDRGANILDEGTWAVPETQQDMQELVTLLSRRIPFGSDAVNITSALYDLLGDDSLFDTLTEVGEALGEKSDAVPAVKEWIKNNMPGLYAKLGLDDSQLDAAPARPNIQPQARPQPQAQSEPTIQQEDLDRMLRIAGLK
jgi:hypothetical protein